MGGNQLFEISCSVVVGDVSGAVDGRTDGQEQVKQHASLAQ